MGILGRVNYYGPWYENAVGEQTYDGAFLVDLEVSYAIVENLGDHDWRVNNVLNVEPDNVTSSSLDEIGLTTGAIVGRPFGEVQSLWVRRRVLVYQSGLQFLGITQFLSTLRTYALMRCALLRFA